MWPRGSWKEAKRLCSQDKEKANTVDQATGSHSGDQGHVLQMQQGQRLVPQNPQESQQGALLKAPRNPDDSREERAEQRLNPKLTLFT